MPWAHCDVAFILDDEDCPKCGMDKTNYTVAIDVTRVVKVARKKAAIELELLNVEENPFGGQEYTATMSNGAVRKGKVNDDGVGRVGNLVPGTCQVEFPQHGVKGTIELTAEFCKGKLTQRYTYRVTHWIEVTLTLADGKPAADEPYKVVFPKEDEIEPREGQLDANGYAREDDLPKAGPCTVVFPKRLLCKGEELELEQKDGQPV